MSQLTLYNAPSRAKGEHVRPGRSAVRPAQQLPPVMRLAFSPSDFQRSAAVGEAQPQPPPYGGPSEEFPLSSRSGRRGTGRGGAPVLDGFSPVRAKTVRRTSSGLTAAAGGTPSRSAIADRGA